MLGIVAIFPMVGSRVGKRVFPEYYMYMFLQTEVSNIILSDG